MLFGKRGLAASLLLVAWSQVAVGAVSIQYKVFPVGGNVYRYVYSITNSGSGAALRLFDILFDTALYQEGSLQIVTPAPLSTEWSQQILHSVPPTIPAAYDALSLYGGVPAGTTVTGFSVQFTWLGSGTPGAQPFQVYDPSTYNLLESGTSTLSPNISIPAASPLSLALLGVALSIAAAAQMKLRAPMRLRADAASRSRSPEAW